VLAGDGEEAQDDHHEAEEVGQIVLSEIRGQRSVFSGVLMVVRFLGLYGCGWMVGGFFLIGQQQQ